MKFTLRQLQDEQRPWVERNFPGRPSWQPLLGICEELGELASAKSDADWLDAIADTVIFAADYCSAMDWDLEALWVTREQIPVGCPMDITEYALVCIGRMQHHHLKASQNIRGSREVHEAEGKRWLAALLDELDDNLADGELLGVVEKTWAKVRARDWVARRKEAAP